MNNRILVVEDQMESMKSAFNFANKRRYGGTLKVNSVPKSQDVDYESLRDNYDLVLVDITLANYTQMNGYGVLRKILDNNYFPKQKLVILSGNSQIEDGLKQNGLPGDLEVWAKPFGFLTLEKYLAKHLPAT